MSFTFLYSATLSSHGRYSIHICNWWFKNEIDLRFTIELCKIMDPILPLIIKYYKCTYTHRAIFSSTTTDFFLCERIVILSQCGGACL